MPPRILTIGRDDNGKSILDWLQQRLGIPRAAALAHLTARRIRINGTPCSNPAWKLRSGQRVEVPAHSPPQRRHTAASAAPSPTPRHLRPVIRHVDDAIVVVEKPAGLTTMRHADEAAEFGSRGRRFLPNTLADLLPDLLATHSQGKPIPVRAVHRLDRDTTGLLVFARTPEAEADLGRQFRAHSVERVYQAIVRGRAVSARIESCLVRDRGDGRRGSGSASEESQRAVTHVLLIEVLGPYSLVECRLETGRTHQVRIHLGEAGTPLCGERIYDRPLHGRPYPDGTDFPRPALHAATLALDHPTTGRRLHWTAPLPRDMRQLLDRLRRQHPAS